MYSTSCTRGFITLISSIFSLLGVKAVSVDVGAEPQERATCDIDYAAGHSLDSCQCTQSVCTELYLGGLNIRMIDVDAFEGLTELTHIDLNSNELKEIPDSLFYSSYLKNINLGYNRLLAVPPNFIDSVSDNTVFIKLDLEKNFLQNLPYLSNANRVVDLTLSGNPVQTLQYNDLSGYTSLQELKIERMGLKRISKGTFSANSALVYVWAAGNDLDCCSLAVLIALREAGVTVYVDPACLQENSVSDVSNYYLAWEFEFNQPKSWECLGPCASLLDSDVCPTGLTCVSTSYKDYTCNCPKGYSYSPIQPDDLSIVETDEDTDDPTTVVDTGRGPERLEDCVNDDECALGTHDCHPEAQCTDTVGSFTCKCNAGFSGSGQDCFPENFAFFRPPIYAVLSEHFDGGDVDAELDTHVLGVYMFDILVQRGQCSLLCYTDASCKEFVIDTSGQYSGRCITKSEASNDTIALFEQTVLKSAYVYTKIQPVAVLNYLGPSVGYLSGEGAFNLSREVRLKETECASWCNELSSCRSFDVALGGSNAGKCQLNTVTSVATSLDTHTNTGIDSTGQETNITTRVALDNTTAQSTAPAIPQYNFDEGNVFRYTRQLLDLSTDCGDLFGCLTCTSDNRCVICESPFRLSSAALCECEKGQYLQNFHVPYKCNDCSANKCRQTYLPCSAYNDLICASCPTGWYGRQCDQISDIDETEKPISADSIDPAITSTLPGEQFPSNGKESSSAAAGNPILIKGSPNITIILIVAVLVAVLMASLVAVIIVLLIRRKRRKETKRRESKTESVELDDSPSSPTPGIRQLPPVDTKLKTTFIDPMAVTVLRTIGNGNFGVVSEGKLSVGEETHHVAIKELKHKMAVAKDEELLAEAAVMTQLYHDNVLRCYGVSILTESNSPCFLMEYMSGGSLNEYLVRNHGKISIAVRIFFAHQIARGMAYTIARGIVHRDLATRNVMLGPMCPGESKVAVCAVKLADFGMSRYFTEGNYYQMANQTGPLPIRWMAPEALTLSKFDERSDVWSFGVSLWEIFSGGKIPYENIESHNLFTSIDNGLRLKKPESCPDSIHNIMLQCWETNPKDRPCFYTIERRLRAILCFYEPELVNTMTEDVYGYVDMERTMLGAGSASINVLHPGYNIMVTEQDRGKSLKQLEKARSTRIRRNSEKNLMVSNVQHKKSQSLSILEGIAIHSISNDSTIPNN